MLILSTARDRQADPAGPGLAVKTLKQDAAKPKTHANLLPDPC